MRKLLALAVFLVVTFLAPTAAFADTTFSGAISGDIVWTKAASPYIVNFVSIPSGSSLTIEPGTIIKAQLDTVPFTVDGVLTIGATSAEQVIITSLKDDSVGGDTNGDGTTTSPARGDWKKIVIHPGAHVSMINTTIRYGGATPYNYYTGGYFTLPLIENTGGILTLDHVELMYSGYYGLTQSAGMSAITNSVFADIAKVGIQQSGGSISVASTTFDTMEEGIRTPAGSLDLGGCRFVHLTSYGAELSGAAITFHNHSGNSGASGINLNMVLSSDTVLPKDGITYVVNYLVVPSGITLTVMPGAVVKLPLAPSSFIVDGTLMMGEGTASEQVYITALSDDSVGGDTNQDGAATAPSSGSWRSIVLNPGSHASIAQTVIRYGGASPYNTYTGGPDWLPAIKNNGGVLTLTNSTLESDGNFGLLQISGTTTITDSEIAHNDRYGMWVSGGTLSIHNSSIHDNATYGVFNASAQVVDATHNWWGDFGGPTHPSNPFGVGDRISDRVDYGNWLTSQPTGGCVTNCYSNVLFLPGLEASRLYRPWVCNQNNCEIRLWEPPADSVVNQLFLNQNGSSTLSDVYTRDILGQAFETGPRVYQSFIEQMNQMATSGVITEWEAIPYDWRFSADTILDGGKKYPDGSISYIDSTSSPYILQELKRLAKNSQTGKVTIIAHSNGGLIAKRLLQRLGDTEAANLVDKLILVASPQTGTPQAIGALLHGYKQGIPDNYSIFFKNSTARVLGENMPGGYQLLPSEAYFNSVGSRVIDPVVEFEKNKSQTAIFRNSYGTEITGVGSMDAFLLGFDGRQKPDVDNVTYPNILHANLLSQANDLHRAIDTWVPTPTIKVTQIAGWGVDTLRTIHYVQGGFFHCLGVTPCIDYDPLVTEDGDGTVVFPSALAISTSTSNVSRYWVDLLRLSKEKTFRDHKNILEVPQLLSFVQQIITNSVGQSLPDFITGAVPNASSDKHLRYFLHSPLSLDIYDDVGRHTGISTTTGMVDNQIPGARYGEFGEVKYISAPASTTLHLVMNGQANGGFTLKIEEAQGNIVVATTTFQDIPSSTSTVVTFDTPAGGGIASSSALRIDENGDGVIDFNLAPKIGDVVTLPVIVPDLTPPMTTATTTGTIGKNGWYTSNVLVTLTATDTESGVASTTYSLNSGVTWNMYTVPVALTQEGNTTILYRSVDKVGNREATNTLVIKIDKTAPEANIAVGTSTQDLLVTGIDNLGTTTVSKDALGNYSITDQAGHTTKLFFTKTYSGKLLTYAKLTGIQYDNQPKITLPISSFLYVWDTKTPIVPVSQTIVVNDTYAIQAIYDKAKNKTTVLVLKKNLPIQTQVFTGLEIVRLTTNNGIVGYSL